MPTITINLGSEITDITSYDVFISECDPISWQLVADDISYDDFPIYVDPAGFDVDGPCFEYYISGDTGCYCQGTDYLASPTPTPTITPSITPTITTTPSVTPTITTTPSVTPTITVTPSITPTITPTPTPSPPPCQDVNLSTLYAGSPPENVNIFLGYMNTSGSGAYQSICDIINCNSITDIGIGSTFLQCDITVPTLSGLPTDNSCVPLEFVNSEGNCEQYTTSNFYTGTCFDSPAFYNQELYMVVNSPSGNTIYTISSGCTGGMGVQLYATCDYDGLDYGIVGYSVELNSSGQWVINGDVEPNLTLECGVEYHFHICSSGSTTQFWMADQYNISSESTPDGTDALGPSDGVDNNGQYVETIVVNFSSAGTNGGYWYGYNGIEGAAGQITVTGC